MAAKAGQDPPVAAVAREIQTAMLCGVPVVPVLLDGAPLPSDVTLQGIDWR